MARVTQKALAVAASLTDAQAAKLSGADLQQAANVAKAGTTVGAGKDGARLEQMIAGISG